VRGPIAIDWRESSGSSGAIGPFGVCGSHRKKTLKADIQVERLIVTSLYRALEEQAPEEMEVFRRWFDPGNRQTQFHVAPLIGAVGYLRRKPDLYERVIETAGTSASARAFASLSQFERRLLKSMPRFGRIRLLRHLLQNGLRAIHKDARVVVTQAEDGLRIQVENSVFCLTPADESTAVTRCHFYSWLLKGLLVQAQIPCESVVEVECKAQGAGACTFEVFA